MFPNIFEWDWSFGHIIFMLLFYGVVGVILAGLWRALKKTDADLKKDNS